MKRLQFYLITPILFVTIQFGFAQKLSQGKVTFVFSYPDESGINSNLLSATEVQGLTVYFKNGKTRAEYKDAEGNVVIIDPKAKEKISIHSNKLAVKMTLDEAQKNQALMFGDSAATITNEMKNIAGYKCRKAIITYEVWKKPNRTVEVWFTNEIAASNPRYSFKGVDGFIMEYSFVNILYPTQEGVDFRETMTCIKVEKENVSDNLFKVPADCHVTTMKEMQENMQIEYH